MRQTRRSITRGPVQVGGATRPGDQHRGAGAILRKARRSRTRATALRPAGARCIRAGHSGRCPIGRSSPGSPSVAVRLQPLFEDEAGRAAEAASRPSGPRTAASRALPIDIEVVAVGSGADDEPEQDRRHGEPAQAGGRKRRQQQAAVSRNSCRGAEGRPTTMARSEPAIHWGDGESCPPPPDPSTTRSGV